MDRYLDSSAQNPHWEFIGVFEFSVRKTPTEKIGFQCAKPPLDLVKTPTGVLFFFLVMPQGGKMLRVIEPVKISFVVAARPADVRTRIIQHLTTQGGRIKVDDDTTILAGFGSNLKIRLLGAMIAGVNAM